MIGKRVVDDLYVHTDWVGKIEVDEHRSAISTALTQITPELQQLPNVAKINVRTNQVSLLLYPYFESDPFPELFASWTFSKGPSMPPHFRRYDNTLNPPLLHRKELLVDSSNPLRESWCEVTRTAESIGLFDSASTIGFRLNWQRAIAHKGFLLDGDRFVPLGNDGGGIGEEDTCSTSSVRRHLTALVRNNLSAPVQMLLRHGFLDSSATFFDYGCGRGSDVFALSEAGIDSSGWDPHFAPSVGLRKSTAVNLGFVVNVIEDAAERVDAVQRAFSLAQTVLSVGVMLYPSEIPGTPFRDGFLSSRQTFQKYFDQAELRDYLEQVLHHPAFLVAPGIAFVFKDQAAEQRFAAGRQRNRQLSERLLQTRRVAHEARPRSQRQRVERVPKLSQPSALERRFLKYRCYLDQVWAQALDLGRCPEGDEMPFTAEGSPKLSPAEAQRLMAGRYDVNALKLAAAVRADDVLIFLVTQQFAKRAPYRQLEPRLQRDIKSFFGDYSSAQAAAWRLISLCADPARLLASCQDAATQGLGWLEESHSLQVHVELVDRLPALLRAYIACGLVLWSSTSDVQLVKIHIQSGKLSLLGYDEFSESAVPSLRRRIKVNIRQLSYEVYEYGSSEFPMPALLWKSRYLNEEQPGYAEQLLFDEQLAALAIVPAQEQQLTLSQLNELLETRRMAIDALALVRSRRVPHLDESCGSRFRFRDFIECGETQRRLALPNVPLNPDSYNALFDLSTQLLDPLVEYFGPIRLTYGFASHSLSRAIKRRIAPKLDQHACCELDTKGRPICDRLGAACDFIVDDEDMLEVAEWIVQHLPFDRLYVYGKDRPLHLSWGPQATRSAFIMQSTAQSTLVPRPFTPKS